MKSKNSSKSMTGKKIMQQKSEFNQTKPSIFQNQQEKEQQKYYKSMGRSLHLQKQKKYLTTLSTEKHLTYDQLRHNSSRHDLQQTNLNDKKIKENSKMAIYKKKRQFFICPICTKQFSLRFKCSFNCLHYYCEDCLQNYIIQSAEKAQNIVCPSNKCQSLLNTKSALFLSLPLSIQYKILQNSIKENLNENSQQFQQSFKKQLEPQNKIKEKYLGSQYNLYRQKTRESYNLALTVQSFKTCKKCHQIGTKKFCQFRIQCICGFIFCYKCGYEWGQNEHICSLASHLHHRSQSTMSNQKNSLVNKQKQKKDCKEKTKQIFFTFIWVLIIVIIHIPKFTIAAILTVIAAILAGITFFACVFIWNQDRPYKSFLLILFYPFALLVGVGIALINFSSFFYRKQVEFYYAVKNYFFKH